MNAIVHYLALECTSCGAPLSFVAGPATCHSCSSRARRDAVLVVDAPSRMHARAFVVAFSMSGEPSAPIHRGHLTVARRRRFCSRLRRLPGRLLVAGASSRGSRHISSPCVVCRARQNHLPGCCHVEDRLLMIRNRMLGPRPATQETHVMYCRVECRLSCRARPCASEARLRGIERYVQSHLPRTVRARVGDHGGSFNLYCRLVLYSRIAV